MRNAEYILTGADPRTVDRRLLSSSWLAVGGLARFILESSPIRDAADPP